MAEDVNRIADLLRNALNPGSRNRLAQTAYNASMRADPPIDVVPDGQMPKRPQYGAETSVQQNVQKDLSGMLGSIQAQRAQNPVYMPFEPGTPTLASRQLSAQEKAQAFQNALAEAGITGSYQGQQTMDARRLAQTAAEAQARLQQQTEQDRLRNQYSIWEATGQAPSGIPGVSAGTGLYNPSAGADAATNVEVAEVLSYGSAEEAYNELAKNAEMMAIQGVDIDTVVRAIERRFGSSGGNQQRDWSQIPSDPDEAMKWFMTGP